MKSKAFLIFGIIFSLVIIPAALSFAQEQQEAVEAAVSAKSEPDTQWVWGEVQNIDVANKAITVKYLDYETDQEKEISLAVDEKTSFENVKSLEGLKLKDAVSVDYAVTGGIALAKSISVENQETLKPDEPTAQDANQVSPEDLAQPPVSANP